MKEAWQELLWMGKNYLCPTPEIKAFQSLRKSLTRFSGAAETLKTHAVTRSGDIGNKSLQFITNKEHLHNVGVLLFFRKYSSRSWDRLRFQLKLAERGLRGLPAALGFAVMKTLLCTRFTNKRSLLASDLSPKPHFRRQPAGEDSKGEPCRRATVPLWRG